MNGFWTEIETKNKTGTIFGKISKESLSETEKSQEEGIQRRKKKKGLNLTF